MTKMKLRRFLLLASTSLFALFPACNPFRQQLIDAAYPCFVRGGGLSCLGQ